MHIFEVEEKEQKNGDWIFNLAILPHRGDTVGHRGIARELAALLGCDMKQFFLKPLKTEKSELATLTIKVQSPLVYRYSAVVLEGVRIEKSPQWLKDRLALLGFNSINNVVDVTNYVMAELGQPLHAFDYDTLNEHQMIVREAKAEERIETLDDLNFKLPKGTLVIEDKNRLIDLAGMKGGKHSAIHKNTKNVVLQAASFSGKHIYKTKKLLGYTTPAADLYTHELDPNATLQALERASELLGKQGRVKIVQVVDIYPKKRISQKLLFNPALLKQYLGASIPEIAAKQILQRLGFQVKIKKSAWEVTVPPFRQDITIPQDLIEEIGRMYGYEKIEPMFPITSLLASIENPVVRLEEHLQNALVETGFTETYSYSFIGEKDLKIFQYSTIDKAALVELQNPYSEDYKYLRPNLIENLLKIVQENTKRLAQKDIRVFELGKVFKNTKGGVAEWHLVSGLLGLSQKDDQEAFIHIKGTVDFVLSSLGITNAWYDNFEASPLRSRSSLWHEKKEAEIKVGNQKIGFLGIIAPQIVSNIKYTGSIAAFTLDINTLLPLMSQEKQYRSIPRFPAVYRDLAVLVPRETKVVDIMNTMHAAAHKYLENIDLFDMYVGDKIPDGQKNLAFHFVYQSPERTLTAIEVDELHQKIIKALEENPEWEVRK